MEQDALKSMRAYAKGPGELVRTFFIHYLGRSTHFSEGQNRPNLTGFVWNEVCTSLMYNTFQIPHTP